MLSMPVVVLGFLLGMLHATDADHVVAVSTLVGRQRGLGGAARIGLLWGVGHSVTVFGVGAAIILFNLVLPAGLGAALEFCVALMLMLLGTLTLMRVGRHVRGTLMPALAQSLSEPPDPHPHEHPQVVPTPHLHLHAHGEYVHAHLHPHGPGGSEHGHGATPLGWLDRQGGRLAIYQALRPIAIGIVHGLAGSAAVALLVLTQIREPGWAVAYLVLFGVGTTAGMVLMTSAIALPFLHAQRWPHLNLALQAAAGVLSLGLGGTMAWQIGLSDRPV